MKIILLKEYAFVNKVKPVGTLAEVTNELGERLVKEGIAKTTELTVEKKSVNPKKIEKKDVTLESINEVEKPQTKENK